VKETSKKEEENEEVYFLVGAFVLEKEISKQTEKTNTKKKR